MRLEDRAKLLNDLRSELLKLQTQRERGTLDNPGRVRAIRRAIARILTIINEETKKENKAGK
ncbi:50S ribosomal protein L29 [Vulcanisaeta moutnovskia 768-28]|uniref:Large ribosomal subunit protein uL29 n=2 Tax=Vulcanisaeta TaxID=164450 RepID=F0QYP3_VULM7|nr:50S ribosomal protein L29 [Vulcanisaeta moutnovskia 768-28]